MFWTVVIAVLAVLLAYAWWRDRQNERRHRGGVDPSAKVPNVDQIPRSNPLNNDTYGP